LERLLREKEAAELLNVTQTTLQTWRSRKTGPPYVKLGTGGIRYKEADLEVWASVTDVDPNKEDKDYERQKQEEIDNEY